MAKQLITEKDYQILGVKKTATPKEVKLAYEKLCLEYHPEKIKKVKFREPNEFEYKKYWEVKNAFEKFEFKHYNYKCCGWNGNCPCPNEFHQALWEKNGHLYCSYECLNRPAEDALKEWKKIKLREINGLEKFLNQSGVKKEDLEENNRNYEQEINAVGEVYIDEFHEELYQKILNIRDRVESDASRKESERKNNHNCDYCHGKIGEVGKFFADNLGNKGSFCSDACMEKYQAGNNENIKGDRNLSVWTRKWKVNGLKLLLEWMEKEGISEITTDPTSGKLLVFYTNQNQKAFEEEELTSQLKEVKEHFQQDSTAEPKITVNALKDELNKQSDVGKDNGGNGLLIVLLVISATAFLLIGFVIHKKRAKRY